jgi:glycosyltransferase involved in cell wall biosynthesis
MNLSDITPLILTFNEEANVERALRSVEWANHIIVVDSFSTDRTMEILRANPKVQVVQRRFDSHSNQWSHGLARAAGFSEWILSMDADYVVTEDLKQELAELEPRVDISGYRISFTYCIDGRALWGSLYPPIVALYRARRARYEQDGHAQRVQVEGAVGALRCRMLHDDRKTFSRWLASQDKYAELEVRKLRALRFAHASWPDRLRKLVVVMPFVALCYCLILKGCLLQGSAGVRYAFQRTVAELILSAKLMRRSSKSQE